MAPPPVSIYVTSLTSQPRVRQHIDLLHRALKGLEIPYETHDLVIDEQAKTRWQRAKPTGQVIGLPGYLVGGEWVGTMDDFEEAVESGTLPAFLKQDQDFGSDPTGNTSGTVAEAELERLMREMTEGDLDKLAGEIGADGVGKVGLINTPPTSSGSIDEQAARGQGERASRPTTAGSGAGVRVHSPTAMSPAKRGSRASMEEKAEVAREMMEAGTVDGLLAAIEKAEGKVKVD